MQLNKQSFISAHLNFGEIIVILRMEEVLRVDLHRLFEALHRSLSQSEGAAVQVLIVQQGHSSYARVVQLLQSRLFVELPEGYNVDKILGGDLRGSSRQLDVAAAEN